MIQERLLLVLKDKKLKLTEMAELCSIPYKTLQNYTLGKTSIGEDALRKVCITLGVNLNWLVVGEGEMYQQPVSKLPSKVQTVAEIDQTLEQLNDEQRQEIFSRTQEMLKMNLMEKEVREMKETLELLKKGIGK